MGNNVCVMGKIVNIDDSNIIINDGTGKIECSFDFDNDQVEVSD